MKAGEVPAAYTEVCRILEALDVSIDNFNPPKEYTSFERIDAIIKEMT